MGTVVWTESALIDIKEIKSFIAHDSKQLADYFINPLFHATEILEKFH